MVGGGLCAGLKYLCKTLRKKCRGGGAYGRGGGGGGRICGTLRYQPNWSSSMQANRYIERAETILFSFTIHNEC